MILAGLGAAGLAYLVQVDAQDNQRLAQTEKDAVQSRLARIEQEEKEIQAGDILFRRLSDRGIVGEEKRMDWVEKIAQIRAQRRLLDVRWDISPQRPLEPELAPTHGGEYTFMASALHLQFALLHEEDLLRFISDLKDGLSAYVRVRQCTLERLSAGLGQAGEPVAEKASGPTGPGPQLQADCQIDLITLRKGGPVPPKQP
jgi:hypothetical protein